jgi:predicted nucleic acid-binding protein
MIDRVYLDSSFIIALLLKNEEFHAQALMRMQKLAQTELFVSFFSLNETLYILSKYGLSKAEVANVVREKFLLLEKIRVINTTETLETMFDYLKFWNQTQLKSTDAMHVFLMKQVGVQTIATFDQDFVKHQKKLGIKTL